MVDRYEYFGMFLVGLLGSGHCVGMCGPIGIALVPMGEKSRRMGPSVLYNLGRITTYTAIGAVLAAVGGGAERAVPLARLQVWIALVSSAFLAWFGLALLHVIAEPKILYWADGTALPGVGRLLRGIVGEGRSWMGFPLGILLGFIPCGLSMAAIVRGASSGGAVEGALLVCSFGVGTLPAMLLVAGLASRLGLRQRRFGEVVAGVILIGMASLQFSKAIGALV